MTKSYFFALVGIQNSGKTKTLNKLIDYFENDPDSFDNITPGDLEQPKNNKDRYAIFKYKAIRIGVATGGDNPTNIINNFNIFKKYDCDVAITAVRVYQRVKAEKKKTGVMFDRCLKQVEIEVKSICNDPLKICSGIIT